MVWPYIVSTVICLAAFFWAVLLAYVERNRRPLILAGLLGVVLLRIVLDLVAATGEAALISPWREFASVAVSVLALLAVAVVRRVFRQEHAAAAANKHIENELRASRARFIGIVDIAEDGIISVNSRHEIVQFNRGAEKIFGHAASEVLGQPLNLVIPHRFAADHGKHLDEFARGPITSRRMGERREVYGLRKAPYRKPCPNWWRKPGLFGWRPTKAF